MQPDTVEKILYTPVNLLNTHTLVLVSEIGQNFWCRKAKMTVLSMMHSAIFTHVNTCERLNSHNSRTAARNTTEACVTQLKNIE